MPEAAAAAREFLRATGLSVERSGRELFQGLGFSGTSGELVQIAGENGAGKTTLLRMLAGLFRNGFEGDVQRFVPVLFLGHLAAVKELLTPRENLLWHPSGLPAGPVDRIDDALARVGLRGYEDMAAHKLSAGQRRRVNLARLYLDRSPLWLLDEPLTAIDRAGVAAIEDRLAAHVAAGGAVVLTSHQPLDRVRPDRELRLGQHAP